MMVYGIDTNKNVTAESVRDAMVECFYEAHCMDSELNGEGSQDKSYCETIVKKAFTETNGDFDNPTKESIIVSMGYLKDFSQNFRDPKIIEKHSADIMKLIEKI